MPHLHFVPLQIPVFIGGADGFLHDSIALNNHWFGQDGLNDVYSKKPVHNEISAATESFGHIAWHGTTTVGNDLPA